MSGDFPASCLAGIPPHTLIWLNCLPGEGPILPATPVPMGEVQALSWDRLVRCSLWPEVTTEQELQGQEFFLAAFRNMARLHKYMPGQPT